MSASSNAARRKRLYAHGVTVGKYGGEPEVVDGAALARVIVEFCAKWEAERPLYSNGGWGSGRRAFFFYGPITWLADQTGIHTDRISKLRRGRFQTVGLGQADALLQAMGTEHGLDGDLEPYPNPRWSPERWHAYMAERVGEECW